MLASFVAALHQESEPVRYLDLSPEVGRTTCAGTATSSRPVQARDTDAAEAAIGRN